MSSDSRGVFLIPSRIFSVSCIQLRQLVPSGRDAINKLKGKTGKRRLFFMIHYMLGGFDLCVMQSRIKPCLTIIYSTGHRQGTCQLPGPVSCSLPRGRNWGKKCLVLLAWVSGFKLGSKNACVSSFCSAVEAER